MMTGRVLGDGDRKSVRTGSVLGDSDRKSVRRQ